MVHRVDEERINPFTGINPVDLKDEELKELRSDLEIELYWLDRENRCMSHSDCIPDSENRTSRDNEIDRDFILDKIKMTDCELRKRNQIVGDV